ncbi:hypothetical protein DENSPDRAFT_885917 [Dentipellis sp. KUC8613]|nr:hypothetical protein DENSPDRAFT_885917 [Dentipellis sp. KUC8613]
MPPLRPSTRHMCRRRATPPSAALSMLRRHAPPLSPPLSAPSSMRPAALCRPLRPSTPHTRRRCTVDVPSTPFDALHVPYAPFTAFLHPLHAVRRPLRRLHALSATSTHPPPPSTHCPPLSAALFAAVSAPSAALVRPPPPSPPLAYAHRRPRTPIAALAALAALFAALSAASAASSHRPHALCALCALSASSSRHPRALSAFSAPSSCPPRAICSLHLPRSPTAALDALDTASTRGMRPPRAVHALSPPHAPLTHRPCAACGLLTPSAASTRHRLQPPWPPTALHRRHHVRALRCLRMPHATSARPQRPPHALSALCTQSTSSAHCTPPAASARSMPPSRVLSHPNTAPTPPSCTWLPFSRALSCCLAPLAHAPLRRRFPPHAVTVPPSSRRRHAGLAPSHTPHAALLAHPFAPPVRPLSRRPHPSCLFTLSRAPPHAISHRRHAPRCAPLCLSRTPIAPSLRHHRHVAAVPLVASSSPGSLHCRRPARRDAAAPLSPCVALCRAVLRCHRAPSVASSRAPRVRPFALLLPHLSPLSPRHPLRVAVAPLIAIAVAPLVAVAAGPLSCRRRTPLVPSPDPSCAVTAPPSRRCRRATLVALPSHPSRAVLLPPSCHLAPPRAVLCPACHVAVALLVATPS